MSRRLAGVSLLLGLLAGCSTLPAANTERIDGQRVEYAQIGHGSPAVVFENGLGATMGSWRKVFREVGKDTTVFAYNRPGYGDSYPALTPRDGTHIVDALRALLRRHDLSPPYVLVGHSLGGLYMQLFARRYPDEVAGLVLVDSTHPTQMEGAGRIERQSWWVRLFFNFWAKGDVRKEFDAAASTGQDVLQMPTVRDKPVIVLSAIDDRGNEVVRHANRKRADFSRLYPGSRQQWIESGHFIQWDRPEVVVQAIRDIVAAGPEAH
jgi:pimeloyl-ACP methyl ester carboxylesterase